MLGNIFRVLNLFLIIHVADFIATKCVKIFTCLYFFDSFLSSIENMSSLTLNSRASLVAQLLENMPTMPETPVQFLGWENPLKKG